MRREEQSLPDVGKVKQNHNATQLGCLNSCDVISVMISLLITRLIFRTATSSKTATNSPRFGAHLRIPLPRYLPKCPISTLLQASVYKRFTSQAADDMLQGR